MNPWSSKHAVPQILSISTSECPFFPEDQKPCSPPNSFLALTTWCNLGAPYRAHLQNVLRNHHHTFLTHLLTPLLQSCVTILPADSLELSLQSDFNKCCQASPVIPLLRIPQWFPVAHREAAQMFQRPAVSTWLAPFPVTLLDSSATLCVSSFLELTRHISSSKSHSRVCLPAWKALCLGELSHSFLSSWLR